MEQQNIPYFCHEAIMARMERRYFDGITYERLAEEFDLSVRQVKYIVYKAEDILSRHL